MLILMDTAISLLNVDEPVYPLDIVKNMRDQRPSMVQNVVSILLNNFISNDWLNKPYVWKYSTITKGFRTIGSKIIYIEWNSIEICRIF